MNEAGARGVCAVAVAPLRAAPDHAAEMVTQVLYGEAFSVLSHSADGDWWEVELHADGYRGWLRSWYGRRAPVAPNDPDGERLRAAAHSVPVRSEPRRRVAPTLYLPWGARAQRLGESDGWLRLALADGTEGYGRRRDWRAGSAPGGNATPTRLLKTAAQFLGVPYVWGGRSTWGMDCSGFVQTVFAWHGVSLPRDSSDQLRSIVAAGRSRPRAAGWRAARRGELLFFGTESGGATHVALAAGEGEFLHALGSVRRGSLDPDSEVFENTLVRSFLGVWPSPRKPTPAEV